MNIDLAYARNQLLNGKCSTELKDNLSQTLRQLVKEHNPFFTICKQCLESALEDIEHKDYVSAGYQINFIHNMPATLNNLKKWDEDHFYEFEVPVFFENTNDIKRIKTMILLLAELVKQENA